MDRREDVLGEAGVQAGTRSISSCREQELRKEEKMKTRYRAQLENVQKGKEARGVIRHRARRRPCWASALTLPRMMPPLSWGSLSLC